MTLSTWTDRGQGDSECGVRADHWYAAATDRVPHHVQPHRASLAQGGEVQEVEVPDPDIIIITIIIIIITIITTIILT